MSESSRRPVVNATPARQGIRGTHIFWVLVISTFLAAAALFLAWMWRAPQFAHANVDNGAPAPSPATIASTANTRAQPSIGKSPKEKGRRRRSARFQRWDTAPVPSSGGGRSERWPRAYCLPPSGGKRREGPQGRVADGGSARDTS